MMWKNGLLMHFFEKLLFAIIKGYLCKNLV